MNVRLRILVWCAATIALVACSGATVTKTANDADTQAFVNATIPAIFSRFDVNELVKAGDPSVYDAARVRRAHENFPKLAARLGRFVAYNGATGTTEVLTTRDGMEIKHASYDAQLSYQRGNATVHMEANKAKGKWMVVDASVQPQVKGR